MDTREFQSKLLTPSKHIPGDSGHQPADAVVKKRSDYLEWDEYFMGVAHLSAMRSKDPSTQVGACIVNLDKKIVGIGYNGMPIGQFWLRSVLQ